MSRWKAVSVVAAALLLGLVAVPNASATLIGTVPLAPGDTVFPGLTASPPGTLLASLSVPFVTTLGTTTGTLDSAVYRESGGTLDFYYQVVNNSRSIDAISRETDTTFTGFTTAVGYRIDGASLPGGVFVNGTVPPVTADRNGGTGDVVGFSFSPPDSAKIQPGMTSNVLVISTNATNFTSGDASVIDGGVATVASFGPASAVPEPGSMLLLGTGVLGLMSMRRRTRR